MNSDIKNLKIEFLKSYQYDKKFFFSKKKMEYKCIEGFSDGYHV